jgi:hypothetical protein
MVEETTDEEAKIVLETFSDLRKHEAPDLALGKAFVEMYRVRSAQRSSPPTDR